MGKRKKATIQSYRRNRFAPCHMALNNDKNHKEEALYEYL
jgi:hypothetical protein